MQTTNVTSANSNKVILAQTSTQAQTLISAQKLAACKVATQQRKAIKLTNAVQRNVIAKQLLQQRTVSNMLTVATQKKLAAKNAINTKTIASVNNASKYMYNCKSMQALSNYCIANSLTQQQTAHAFISAYAVQNVTNLQFIAARIIVYTALSVNKFKVVAKATATQTV